MHADACHCSIATSAAARVGIHGRRTDRRGHAAHAVEQPRVGRPLRDAPGCRQLENRGAAARSRAREEERTVVPASRFPRILVARPVSRRRYDRLRCKVAVNGRLSGAIHRNDSCCLVEVGNQIGGLTCSQRGLYFLFRHSWRELSMVHVDIDEQAAGLIVSCRPCGNRLIQIVSSPRYASDVLRSTNQQPLARLVQVCARPAGFARCAMHSRFAFAKYRIRYTMSVHVPTVEEMQWIHA